MDEAEPGAGAEALGVVMAEVLGFEHDEALTLGRAVRALTLTKKGFPWDSSSRPRRGSKNSAGRCVRKKP